MGQVTVFTDNLPECVQLSRLVRSHYPEKIIVFGGMHTTALPDESLNFCDYAVVGEAFTAFPELVASLDHNMGVLPPRGIWRQEGTNGILRNGAGTVMRNIDALPFQLYDPAYVFVRRSDEKIIALNRERYVKYIGYTYATMMSMGCPYSCSYCCNNVLKKLSPEYGITRWHSSDYIINEILAAQKWIEFYSVWFMDDSFLTMPQVEFDKFTHDYKKKIGLPLAILGIIPRMAAIYMGRIEQLIACGLTKGGVGVQTGSRRMLASYGREQSNEDVMAISKSFASHAKQTRTSYDILLDGIDETPDDVLETLKLVNQLQRPILLNFFSLRTYPGTDLYGKTPQSMRSKESYLKYRHTIGNLLIGIASLWRLPSFIIQIIEKRPEILAQTAPFFLSQSVDILLMMKRFAYHIKGKDYCRLPSWLVRFIWFLGIDKKPTFSEYSE